MRQRESGRWAVVLDAGVDPETGKRKQKWQSGFKTKGEAEDALVDLLGKRLRDETIDPSTTPLVDYLMLWIDGRADELAPLSLTTYRSAVRNHVKGSALGRMPLGKIRRAHIRQHAAELQRNSLGVARRNVVAAVISRALGDAVADDLIASNPCDGARRSGERKAAPTRFTLWSAAELRALLDAAAGDRLEALWRLAVASGARRGELLGATWLGFSATDGTLTIAQQVVPTRGGVSILPCKTKGSHRTIRIDAETVAALEAHREAQLAERAFAGDAYVDRDLVFADELGGPLNPQRITETFGKLRKAAGIRAGRLHDVRHSHATHLLTNGIPVHIVAARLGHSSPVITLNTYAHVLPTSDARAAEVMATLVA